MENPYHTVTASQSIDSTFTGRLHSGGVSEGIIDESALMIFDRHANLKYRYGSRNFRARGYFADTAGKNEKLIANYIKNQLEKGYTKDLIFLKEFADLFAGERNKFANTSSPFWLSKPPVH